MNKLLIWLIAFPIAFAALVILSLIELIVNVFELPTGIWKIINGDFSALEE